MALLFETVADIWCCICHFSLFRDFANVKAIFILESKFNRIGHVIYIKILNQIFGVRQEVVVVIKYHL